MKSALRILLFIGIAYFGLLAVKTELGGYETGFLTDFKYFPHFLLLVFAIPAFFIDWSGYRHTKKYYQFVSTGLSAVLIAIIVFKTGKRDIIESKEVIVRISNLPKANNVIRFEFKKGNDFKLIEYNRIGQVIYYGKYDKVNDTIKITSSNYNGFAKMPPESGYIKKDTMIWKNFDTMLVDKQ